MEVFNSSIDILRIVFLLGAVIALVWKKKFGITPGGIIIPGVLALILDASVLLFSSVLATAVIIWVLYDLCFSSFALSKRWASLVTMAMSVSFSLAVIFLAKRFQLVGQEILLLSSIAPGLIALSARKYALAPTLHHTLAATAVTYGLGWLLATVLPFQLLTGLTTELSAYKPIALVNIYITMAISMLMAILTYAAFKLRSGGYMIAPFLAVVIISSPIQALLLTAGTAACYGIVRLMQRLTLIIGLERFVLSLFAAYFVMTLIDLLASHVVIPGYQQAPVILMVAMAVLTNDLCLQPVKESLGKGFSPSLAVSAITRLAA